MKLYIKQKVFSWRDKFYVKDEEGNDRYYIESEIFTLAKKLHVYDMEGNEVCYIEGQIFTFLPKYRVYVGGEVLCEVSAKLSFLRPKYEILGLNWKVEGDFFAHNYMIWEDGELVVVMTKEWMTWGDTYQLDIKDDDDEIFALATILAIDCVQASQNKG